jgi:ubiquinone/menaquinone biosynthesis C-methylase UbiE
MARVDYWNHNVHYQPVILAAVPDHCRRALDVGCGDGLLAARLADRCAEVTGIDSDPPMIARARAEAQTQVPDRLRFTRADFLTYPLPEASFDFVCANTSLHHMDFEQALTTMARLLKPGGRLAVIGIAADGSIGDTLAAAASVIANRYYQAVHHEGDPGAPVKAPDMTWAQVRTTARRLLPGVRYRRHLLWRYSLLWTKPRSVP